MPWQGTPTNVDIGAGKLWVASLGATQPTNASTVLVESEDDGADGEWVPVGYTEAGSTFTYTVASEGIQVAEELEEILRKRTSTSSTIAFAMAEATSRNLTLAMNGGLIAAPTSITPVDAEDEIRVMFCLETDSGARWLFRRCYNTGNVEMTNGKAPAKRLIPVTYTCEKPDAGTSWVVFPNADGLI